ncbi:MAG: hypothetical protein J6C81_01130 [Muribaculaceae bacterium]|nr:hypothetical protein [Muribaculaceae bacterium]
MKKLSIILFSAICLLAASAPASAVTREEMEQARATAAKWYLRYANNMSAYLDDLNPKSVNELEGQLKDKEKENIIKFNSIATPTDYASWDKEKLVAYWGGDFFKNNRDRLGEKGADCYNKVKEAVSTMTVSAPGTPEPAPATASQPVENAAPLSLADSANVDAGEVDAAATSEESGKKSNTWTYIILIGILIIVVIWLVAYASKSMKEKNENASRRSSERRRRIDDDDFPSARPGRVEERPAQSAAVKRETIGDTRANDTRLRRMERELTDKEAEIRRLEADLKMAKGDLRHAEAQLDETNRMLEEARAEIRRLRAAAVVPAKTSEEHADRPRHSFHKNPIEAEVYGPTEAIPERPSKPATEPVVRPAVVKSEPVRSHKDYMPKEEKVAAPRIETAAEAASAKVRPVQQPDDEKTPSPDETGHIYMPRTSTPAAERTIFLGRVNSKGIFVRADRSFNPGNSYYRLVTSDGTTGKFSVINDPSVWEQALVAPDDILFNACIGPKLNETHGRNEVITEESGKAVFENGAWRVTDKAKIRYL